LNASAERRSRIMRAVKSQNTAPEKFVRSLLHSLGFRYRLHRKDLPGKPDIVFPARGKVIFVHGCFWHGHTCRRGARTPKNNADYWIAKIERNRVRDKINVEKLRNEGWQVLMIWECEIGNREVLANRLTDFLLS
jgi:DNA mismatch endonuclease (patch repair protein)